MNKFAVFIGRQTFRETIRWHRCSIYLDHRDGAVDSGVLLA
jgi:hypothetical protein